MPRISVNAGQARRAIDQRLAIAPSARHALATPPKGWIKAIREALGMTAAQLGRRLGVSQATIANLEKSEAYGTIKIASLRRAAEAMNCTLVYALIPNRPLEEMVRQRARAIAEGQLRPIEQTMLLEDQSISPEDRQRQLDDFIRNDLNLRLLWDQP